jgi:hypothetical protein
VILHMPDHEAIEFHLINELVEPQWVDPGKKATRFRLHRENRPTRFGRPLSGQKPPAERFVDHVLEAPVVPPSHAGERFGKIVVEGQRRTHEQCTLRRTGIIVVIMMPFASVVKMRGCISGLAASRLPEQDALAIGPGNPRRFPRSIK